MRFNCGVTTLYCSGRDQGAWLARTRPSPRSQQLFRRGLASLETLCGPGNKFKVAPLRLLQQAGQGVDRCRGRPSTQHMRGALERLVVCTLLYHPLPSPGARPQGLDLLEGPGDRDFSWLSGGVALYCNGGALHPRRVLTLTSAIAVNSLSFSGVAAPAWAAATPRVAPPLVSSLSVFKVPAQQRAVTGWEPPPPPRTLPPASCTYLCRWGALAQVGALPVS